MISQLVNVEICHTYNNQLFICLFILSGKSRPTSGKIFKWICCYSLPGSSVGIATWYRLDGPGIESRCGVRFSAPVQTGPGAHPASCTMGTGSFPGAKSGRGETLTPHPLIVPWSWKGTAIPLLPLWAVRPVQSLSACTRVTFTFTFTFILRCHPFLFMNRCLTTNVNCLQRSDAIEIEIFLRNINASMLGFI